MKKLLPFFKKLSAVFAMFAMLVAGGTAFAPTVVSAQESIEKPVVEIYHSKTCPHCRDEMAFLKGLKQQYPDTFIVEDYEISSAKNKKIWNDRVTELGADETRGFVPFTVIGDEYQLGFSESVEDFIKDRVITFAAADQIEDEPVVEEETPVREVKVALPFVGERDLSKASFFGSAILLGFLDGFNVCSLGALVLVLAMALRFKKRKHVLAFGGSFLVVTAILYGVLVFAWSSLFTALGSVVPVLQYVIGAIALLGGIFFVKEFFRIKKQGMICETTNSSWVNRVTEKVQKAFDSKKGWAIAGAVILFAVVLTLVEFPCSAAIPVTFAAILADAGLSSASQAGYIGLFVLFYLLDELIIFGLAVWKMKIVNTSQNWTLGIIAIEAILLIAVGLNYLVPALF